MDEIRPATMPAPDAPQGPAAPKGRILAALSAALVLAGGMVVAVVAVSQPASATTPPAPPAGRGRT
jgi:hypothetical protein